MKRHGGFVMSLITFVLLPNVVFFGICCNSNSSNSNEVDYEFKFDKVDAVSQQQQARIIDNEKDIEILKVEVDETRKDLLALRRIVFKNRTEFTAGSAVLEDSLGTRRKNKPRHLNLRERRRIA